MIDFDPLEEPDEDEDYLDWLLGDRTPEKICPTCEGEGDIICDCEISLDIFCKVCFGEEALICPDCYGYGEFARQFRDWATP